MQGASTVSEKPEDRRLEFYCIVLLAAFITVLFSDVLFFGNQLFLRDLASYYYPTKRVIREILLSGSFPFWNPYYSAGQPMAANPEYEVFYPLQWLILLPSYDFGFRLHILMHLYIGAAGSYLFLRSLGLRRLSSLIGAVTFVLGGPFLSLTNLLPILFCVAWIPWIALFARRFFLRPNGRDLFATACFLGMQALAAEPTTLLQTWILIGWLALGMAWGAAPRSRALARAAAWAVLLIACGIAVGAVQLFPALDHVRDSVRSRPFPFDVASSWSFPTARLPEILFPQILGPIHDKGMWHWGTILYPGEEAPFLISIYFGTLAACLIAAGLYSRPQGWRWWGGLCVVSLAIATGSHTPLFAWLRHLPYLGSIRYPEKFLLTPLLVGITVAAIFFDRLLDGDSRLRRRTAVLLILAGSLAGSIWLFSFTSLHGRLFVQLWEPAQDRAEQLILLSRSGWLAALVRCLAFSLLVLAISRMDRRRWSLLAVALVVIDLASLSNELLPRVPARFYSPPPALSLFSGPERGRLFHEAQWDFRSVDSFRYNRASPSSHWFARGALLPMMPAAWGIPTVLEVDYDSTSLLPTADLLQAVWQVSSRRSDWREIFGAMSGVSHRAVYRPFDAEMNRVGDDPEAAIPIHVARMEGNPRYYFADQLSRLTGPEDFARQLSGKSFSRRVAFVPFHAFEPAPGVIREVSESPGHIELEAEARGRTYLVLSITPHKYWRAKIDGTSVPLQVTNVGYSGLMFPPGRHRVVLHYRNEVVLLSLLISCVSLLSFLALAFLWRPRRVVPGAVLPPQTSSAV